MTAFSPNILVLSAPSGAGKSSLIRALAETNSFHYSISYTTRAPRPGEIHGQDYFFVTEENFLYLDKGGAFVETTKIHGHYYGTPWKNFVHTDDQHDSDSWIVLDIDVPGFEALLTRVPELLSIFILPPSLSSLKERIEQRQPDICPNELSTRLKKAREEVESAPLYQYTVVNDNFEDALSELNFILSCERLKNSRRKNHLGSLLENLEKNTHIKTKDA